MLFCCCHTVSIGTRSGLLSGLGFWLVQAHAIGLVCLFFLLVDFSTFQYKFYLSSTFRPCIIMKLYLMYVFVHFTIESVQ